jgi:hypothetical protein
MHLELFLIRVLIPSASVVGIMRFFFFSGVPAVFLREESAGNVTPFRVLVVVQISSFLPSARGLEFPLFGGGKRALLQSQWGTLGLCAWWEAGLLPPAK